MQWMSSDISVSFPSEILKHLLTEVKSLKSTLQVRCAGYVLSSFFVSKCLAVFLA